jgi:hypothetical protein
MSYREAYRLTGLSCGSAKPQTQRRADRELCNQLEFAGAQGPAAGIT